MSQKQFVRLALLLVGLFILAACQPQTVEVTRVVTETEQVEVTRVVTETVTEQGEQVEVTRVVTEEVEVTAVPAAQQEVIFALYQEPQILNPYIATQTASGEVNGAMIEGLVGASAEGEYIPVLAQEVPSLANGLVTYDPAADVLTVTYNLKEGVMWSDGAPFTCDDVLFTYEAIMDPESGAVSTSGYDQITNMECSDELTAVVTYSPFYAPFTGLFGSIMPRHATGAPAEMQRWPYNWHPIGTGPFKMTEWVPGDHITLVKNENYREAPEKPYLDRLVIRITPSREVGMALIQTGEVDFVWDLIEAVVPDLEGKPGVAVHITPGIGTERLLLNMADPTIDATDDPANNPHPLLGDVRVRQAIEAAINKDEINDVLLFGAASVGTGELNIGWGGAGCELTPSTFDPEAAMALLDEAGFTDADGDGIRECNGCETAAAGTPMRLKIQTTTGNQLREQAEQLIIEYLADVGIDMFIENVPSAELFGSWASGAFRKHGMYDVLMYTTSPGIDPHSFMFDFFHSSRMPLEANEGSGTNYMRYLNADNDAALEAAGSTPDIPTRQQLYCQVMQQVQKDVPMIYLYNRAEIHATSDKLTGYQINTWDNQTWDSENWQMSE